ncbi:MAG: protein kinase domain-containing protein [Gemmatimonadota bacterium]
MDASGARDANDSVDERLRPYEAAAARLTLDLTGGPRADPLGLVGTTVGRYRVDAVLGAGGMGILYRATDQRLGRVAALKFLPPAVSLHADRKRRFLNEARAASALDHANICTIYEADETPDGRMYIAMACYEGETLKERLARGRLQVDEAVRLIAQAARGLAAAHERGLVHRDIKPANLFVTDEGTLKILDFGIARMPGEELTRPDQRPGTAAYMAPEQARGEAVDGKTDVWALGLVLHEMLTGARPSAVGGSPVVARDDPALLPCGRLLDRMLDPDPAARPAAAELARITLDGVSPPSVDRSPPWLAHASGASPAPTAPGAVAVLPFADLSPEGDQDYLCEGMAEEILDALARIEGLRVTSRLSSRALAELPSDVEAIGRRLNVDTLVDGSIRKADARIRISARLVRAPDGSVLWSGRYDRELADVFAIQEDIARSVAAVFRLTLGGEPLASLRAARTAHVEAYEHYLRGRQLFLRDTRRDLVLAREMFARAVAIDPEYARGYAGLADTLSFLYKHFDHDPALLARASEASRTAVELDPGLSDAHTSRAVVHWLEGRIAEATGAFEEAIRLDRASFEAHYLYGMCCYSNGMVERGIEAFGRAAARRPDDFQSPNLRATLCREAGRSDEAMAGFERGLRLAERHLELNPDNVRARYHAALALAGLGRTEEGLARAREVLELAPTDAMVLYNVAAVHGVAGRIDEALDYLERCVDAGFRYGPDLLHDPDFTALRDRPRFRKLLERLSVSG